ncbi:unnamed protein product [Bursaphelenchus xylophilus]|uniref:(pine wood nematode) hypothetical protein n=1 Tax=Bursaphelenchus xylophilus TaxID=6326 RepID=A0A1I7SA10_BURXY|nr:unnamed protein product [Bursaphelenchus xylophilus]CAG9126076.1 unnamed protein product [Bursaphelenchus xylophilus]
MSSKSKAEDKNVESFCKGFFAITDNCVKEENQISFVHSVICALEHNVQEENRQDVVKKSLLYFLKKLQFDSEEELDLVLDLWKKFSKTSRNLGPVAIFKNIEPNYQQFWQYYRLYVEALIEHGQKDEIPKVLTRCAKNCEMTMDELRTKFGRKFHSVFPPADDDSTIQLMQSVTNLPNRKSVVPSKDKKAHVQRRRSSLAPPKLDMVLEKSLENSINEPRTSDTRKSALKDFQETLPASQTTQVISQSQPKKSDDFSIFCDEPSAHGRISPKRATTVNSPAHKKPRISPECTTSLENISAEKENVEHKLSLDINSPTVCGFGRPSNFDAMSSTPEAVSKARMSILNVPPLEFDRGASPLDLSKDVLNSAPKTISKPDKRATPSPNLECALGKLAINGATGSHEDLLESTVNQSLEFNGELNPWDEKARLEMVKKATLIVNQHDFTKEKAPKFDVNHKVVLGGETFFISQLLGHGGFAKVFKAGNDEAKHFAIKFQQPACPYEVHMIATVCKAMPPRLKDFVMQIRDAFIFKDASAIVYDYGQYGTALDLANTYKTNKREIYGGALTLIALQLAEVLKYIHKAEIIHADIKPDNLLLCEPPEGTSSITVLRDRPIIKLIDFGRAIDMKYFKGKEFKGRSKTNGFDCCEMKEGRPWTYQTDFFGYVATLYLLIMNNYMEIQKVGNKYKPTNSIKRRLVNRHVFVELLDEFLNIPSCSELPDWDRCIQFITENLMEVHKTEPIPFRNGVQAMFDMIKHSKPK